MKILLLSGKAGAGKSTIANLIKETDPENIMVVSFAKAVKEYAKMAGWNGIKDEAGRLALQVIGEFGRYINEDFWVEKVLEIIKENTDKHLFIIDDWRYPNEFEFLKFNLKDTENKIIRARVYTNRESTLTEEQQKHKSETSLAEGRDSFDMGIYNYGSIEDICKVIDELVKDIKEY